jgi:hypothetical protein
MRRLALIKVKKDSEKLEDLLDVDGHFSLYHKLHAFP